MEIRNLTENERSDALILAGKVLFEESGSWSEEGAKKILAFLREYTEDFAMLGAFDETLKGVLIYEPESLRIVFLATAENARHEKHAVSLLDRIMEQGRTMHLPRIRLNAALSARSFYEAYGFEVCGEESESEGLRFVPMEYLLQKEWLGRTVTVITDRPYGSFHPHLPDVLYPVNYGYIEGTIAADGEAQDAYILGINEPVKEFTGEVIGIVHREDDVETKLVVAPQGSSFTSEQIMSRINFAEKYFKSYVVMKLKDIDVDPEDLVALGFKIREGHCCYFLSMDETTSKETLLKLFDLLTIEQELTFWSFYRYSGSDPGEYVTVSVENGKAVAIRGNHGWSSGYESISIDDLIELIQRNWDKDWDSIKNYVNSIGLRRVPFPESRRNWMEHPTGVFVPDYSLRAW